MTFSLKYNEYFLEIWLAPNTEFYISQKSKNYLIDSFPQYLNSLGNIVNYIPAVKVKLIPRKFKSLNLNYYFDSSGNSIGKTFNLNEDAFFCNDKVLGVADGIGSLKDKFGISSHDFSHELIHKCEYFSKTLKIKPGSCKEILKQAYNSIECGGSSTILLAALAGRQMNVLNLGDCGLVVIRTDSVSKVVFQTSAKVHCFNTPYQLARRFSIKQLDQTEVKINIDKTDDINDADEFVITTLPGDFVVMGSDGLWDNLYTAEIVKIVEQYKEKSASDIAAILTKMAKIRAVGFNKTPFSVNLRRNFEFNEYIGGKVDDITVVIAKVLIR